MPPRKASGIKGFTMIELITAISIFAILCAIAIPGYLTWLPKYRLKSAARDVMSHLQRAKMEAAKRNADVVWRRSGRNYMVFVDDGAGGGVEANNIRDGSENIIGRVTLPSGVRFPVPPQVANPPFGGAPVAFNSRGLATFTLGSAILENKKGLQYTVSVSPSGNITIQ